jgi:formylglycine-generating enzyme required for sulfatase activity
MAQAAKLELETTSRCPLPAALLVATLLSACAGPHTAARDTGPAPGDAPPGMVWIPGGRFTMGSEGEHALPAERPAHEVDVDGFFMDVHTVTNAEFRAFVDATGYVTIAERAPDVHAILAQLPPGTPAPPKELLVPGSVVFSPTDREVDLRDWSQWWRWVPGADWRHPGGPGSSIEGKDDHPVVQVAWDDAVAYATWAGKRLPTEAEWEYAARGGPAGTDQAWGSEPFDMHHPPAHIYEGEFPTHDATTVPVGSYPPNGAGLYDMSGNVWEWTNDWYHPDAYRADAAAVPHNPTGASSGLDPASGNTMVRTLRGGSFLCNDVYCRGYRASARSPGATDTGGPHIGFRLVMGRSDWDASR